MGKRGGDKLLSRIRARGQKPEEEGGREGMREAAADSGAGQDRLRNPAQLHLIGVGEPHSQAQEKAKIFTQGYYLSQSVLFHKTLKQKL